MSRQAYFGRWLWFWLACYAALVAGLVWWLLAARSSALKQSAVSSAQSDWQAWREEVRREQSESTTVQRRVPVSVEPPSTVLLRDNFIVILIGAVVLGSVLYWVTAWFVTGALSTDGPGSEKDAE